MNAVNSESIVQLHGLLVYWTVCQFVRPISQVCLVSCLHLVSLRSSSDAGHQRQTGRLASAGLVVVGVRLDERLGNGNDGEAEPETEDAGEVADVLDQVQSWGVGIASVASTGQVNEDAMRLVVLRQVGVPLEGADGHHGVVLAAAVLPFAALQSALVGHHPVQCLVLLPLQLGVVHVQLPPVKLSTGGNVRMPAVELAHKVVRLAVDNAVGQRLVAQCAVVTAHRLVRRKEQLRDGLAVAEGVAGVLGIIQVDAIRLTAYEAKEGRAFGLHKDDQSVDKAVV